MRILLTIAMFLTLSGSYAQSINTARIDSLLDLLEKNKKFMGSVAVSKGGQVLYARAVGYADMESKQLANPDTKYRIGSISKSFTSALVLKAAEEKKLSLDDKLSKWYPAIPNADKITIAMMLGHRSGIHSITDEKNYLEWNTKVQSEQQMLDIMIREGSKFAPDSKAEYSNSNYLLASYILQKLYKKSYADILTEKIIKPLGLKNTYVGGAINPKKNEAYSYESEKNWGKSSETDMSIPLGAGAIVSTPSDINRFATALFEVKLISKESLARMMEIKEGYGLGLFPFPYYGKTVYGHTGGIDAFTSIYSYFPADGISYAATSNGIDFDFNTVSLGVLNATFNNPFKMPDFSNVTVPVAELEKLKGTYGTDAIPLKITIDHDGTSLTAKPDGQGLRKLAAKSNTVFTDEAAGVVVEFKPQENSFIFRQGGRELVFKKQ